MSDLVTVKERAYSLVRVVRNSVAERPQLFGVAGVGLAVALLTGGLLCFAGAFAVGYTAPEIYRTLRRNR